MDIQPITLFDSYQKNKVTISPDSTAIPGVLSVYSCGPTVYGYQHIGNYRAVWIGDMISRVARIGGWGVRWVMNITDVGHIVGDGDDGVNVAEGEDKIEKGARRDGLTAQEIIDKYTNDFLLQSRRFHFDIPEGKFRPKATEYILEQMIISLSLFQLNRAYLQDDGIYFDTEANQDLTLPFPINTDGDSGYTGREIRSKSKNPSDFALWKFVDPNSLQKWQFAAFPEALAILNSIPSEKRRPEITSLWGCPGWHTECVAMIASILGISENPTKSQSFSFAELSKIPQLVDIHTGGEDHIPVHHRNEILQSEALGFHLSKLWVHEKHVLVDGGKMSKSKGNLYLPTDIIDRGYDLLSYRMLLHENDYSEQLNFTWDKLTQSQNRLFGLRKDIAQIRSFCELQHGSHGLPEVDEQMLKEFSKPLFSNLNLPLFLQNYQQLVGEVLNTIISEAKAVLTKVTLIQHLEELVIDLDLWPDIPSDIRAIAEERNLAKINKNYEKSDHLRNDLQLLNWSISDYPWGYGLWKMK